MGEFQPQGPARGKVLRRECAVSPTEHDARGEWGHFQGQTVPADA